MTQPHGERLTSAPQPLSVADDIVRIDTYASEVFPEYLRTQAYDKFIYSSGFSEPAYDPDGVDADAYMQRWVSIESLQQRIRTGSVAARSILDERVFQRTFGMTTERFDTQRAALLALKEAVEAGVYDIGIATEATDLRPVMGGGFYLFAYGDELPSVLTECSYRGDVITGYEGEDVFIKAQRAFEGLWQDPTVLRGQRTVIRHIDWVVEGLDYFY